MPEVSIDLNMVRVTNDDFVKKAEACVLLIHTGLCFYDRNQLLYF